MLYQEHCSNLRNLSRKLPEIYHQNLLPQFLLEKLGCHRMIEYQAHLHPMLLRHLLHHLLQSFGILVEEEEAY